MVQSNKKTLNKYKTISTFALLFHDPNGFLRWRSLSDRINGPHQWNDPHWRYLRITISISFTRKKWINVHRYPRLWKGKCHVTMYMLQLYPLQEQLHIGMNVYFTFLVHLVGVFFPKAFQIRNHSFPKYVEVNKIRAYIESFLLTAHMSSFNRFYHHPIF